MLMLVAFLALQGTSQGTGPPASLLGSPANSLGREFSVISSAARSRCPPAAPRYSWQTGPLPTAERPLRPRCWPGPGPLPPAPDTPGPAARRRDTAAPPGGAAQPRSAAHGASHGGQRAAVPAGQRGRQLPRGREPPGAREEGGRTRGRAGGAGTAPRPRPLRSGGAERALGRLPGAAPAELRGGGAAAAGRLVSTGPGRLFPQRPG